MRDFPYNCGIGVIGDFNELNPHNYMGRKLEYETELAEMLPEVQGDIKDAMEYDQNPDRDENENGDRPDPKKVYIATTSERQTPAIQALKNLGFRALTSWQGNEGKITLWIKKAEA